MSLFALSVNLDTAKTVASGLSLGSIAIAVIAAVIVKNMVVRVVSLVFFLALGLASYSQRSNLMDCADKVTATAGTQTVSCTFFGQQVEIPSLTK